MWRRVLMVALAGLAFFVVLDSAQASDYGAGHMHYTLTDLPQAVVSSTGTHPFGVQLYVETWWNAWSVGNLPPIGTVLPGTPYGELTMGDGTTVPTEFVVQYHEETFYGGYFVMQGTNELPYHVYPAPNDNGQPWHVLFDAKISRNPISHINNPGVPEIIDTYIDLASPNRSPMKMDFEPIQYCYIDWVCEFSLETDDPDGDKLEYYLASYPEAANDVFIQPGPPYSQYPAQVDSQTGVVTWNTVGAQLGPKGAHYYSMEVGVSDGLTKVPLDFLIVLVPPPCDEPGYWQGGSGNLMPGQGGSSIADWGCPCPAPEPGLEGAYWNDSTCAWENLPCDKRGGGNGESPAGYGTPGESNNDGDSNACYPHPNPDPRVDGEFYLPGIPEPIWKAPAISNEHGEPLIPQDRIDEEIANLDQDGDGIVDREDLCVQTPSAGNLDLDGDMLGNECDDDLDGDGIRNSMDPCPYDAWNLCAKTDVPEAQHVRANSASQVSERDGADMRAQASVHVQQIAAAQKDDGSIAVFALLGALSVLLLAMVVRRRDQD